MLEVLAWILGPLVVYVAVGWRVVVHWAPTIWERQRAKAERDGRSYTTPSELETDAAGRVRIEAINTFALWPFRLPYLLISEVAEKRDPKRLEREIAARDRKIAELERRYLQ